MRRLPRTITALALAAVVFASAAFVRYDDDFFALRKNFELFSSIYQELVGGYVDDLDAELTMRAGIDAMLERLDPYTVFIDEARVTDARMMRRGQVAGVGLNVAIQGGRVVVIAPVEEASGYQQGVRTGDVLTRIDGRDATGLSRSDVDALLQGEPGTTVDVLVEREGEPAPLPFVLTRQELRETHVPFYGRLPEAPGVGYVKLDVFGRGADNEVAEAVRSLVDAGGLDGLILDLRGNLGGLLDGAVNITGLFVPQGSVVVSTRGRLAESEAVYRTQRPPVAPDVPLVVLIDGFSASASEIVAGALQDADRAVVLGETSFGKGLVQIVKPMPYNTSLKMTTARYYLSSGRGIQRIDYTRHDGTEDAVPDSLLRAFTTAGGRTVYDGRGIAPDVALGLGSGTELEQALTRKAAFFRFASTYVAENPGGTASFTADARTLRSFRAWLDAESFAYETKAERELEDLAGALAEGGFDSATDELDRLRAAVERAKTEAFDAHADRMTERLRAAIVARYASPSEQAEAALPHDVQVQRAAEMLADGAAMARVLGQ